MKVAAGHFKSMELNTNCCDEFEVIDVSYREVVEILVN